MAVDVTLLQTRLDNALVQYDKLVTGQLARVFVDQNGERVEFTASLKADLYTYIQQLQAQIACPNPMYPTTGPMRFIF